MSEFNHEHLLDALSENSLVKASIIVDKDGQLRGRRGHANVLRQTGPEDITETLEKTARENVYMVEMRQDILIVVFDESIEFERLRNAVDVLLRHTGLDKNQDPAPS